MSNIFEFFHEKEIVESWLVYLSKFSWIIQSCFWTETTKWSHNITTNTKIKKQPPEVFCKKGFLRNFANFTGNHLCQSFFFNKIPGLACNFIKKETLAQFFSCEVSKISKNTFFTEHLWATASGSNLKRLYWNTSFFDATTNISYSSYHHY